MSNPNKRSKPLLNNFLSESSYEPEPTDIRNFSKEELVYFLKLMRLIRSTEIKIAEGKKQGLIGGPVHLGVGQEAIATGLSKLLNKSDRVFGAHRSHSHILSLNKNPYGLFAEVLAKKTGLSKGMGGSMHLWDEENGFMGSVPIVSGTVSLSVGAALASKLQKKSVISVAYLGDGAVEEGVVHESLNLSSILNVPILFVVENNLFSSHMHINLRQPFNYTSRFAKVNNIDSQIVDGNDVIAIYKSGKKLIQMIRDKGSPAFLEAFTYRWFGHVDWRDDIDVGIKRSKEDIKLWKRKDPILRLENAMIQNKFLDEDEIINIQEIIDDKIEKDWAKAMKDEEQDKNDLLNNVYS